jgi:hypothetical protein
MGCVPTLLPTPSPRPSGEQGRGEEVLSWKQRLLAPALFLPAGREKERENNGGSAQVARLNPIGGKMVDDPLRLHPSTEKFLKPSKIKK